MSTRHSRFLQYKLMASFSGSKGRRIFEGILFTFSDMIDSSRESMLGCWTCGGFEREIFGFVDIESIDVMFRRKSLESHAKDRGSSSSKRCARCVRCVLEADR